MHQKYVDLSNSNCITEIKKKVTFKDILCCMHLNADNPKNDPMLKIKAA